MKRIDPARSGPRRQRQLVGPTEEGGVATESMLRAIVHMRQLGVGSPGRALHARPLGT
jgi:hypothetical protein